MNIQDALQIFGFDSVNFSEDELKQKYRKLAFENHPDRHNDEREVYENKMKEINEAYQILKNIKSSNLNIDFNTIEECLKNTVYNYVPPQDIMTTVNISLYDFILNSYYTLSNVPKFKNCPNCFGYKINKDDYIICDVCNGHGMVVFEQNQGYTFYRVAQMCPNCAGLGVLFGSCNQCNKDGLIVERNDCLKIDFSKISFENEMKYVFKGYGLPEKNPNKKNNLERGDLVVSINVVDEKFNIHRVNNKIIFYNKNPLQIKIGNFIKQKTCKTEIYTVKNNRIEIKRKNILFNKRKITFGQNNKFENNIIFENDKIKLFYDLNNKITTVYGLDLYQFLYIEFDKNSIL